MGRLSPSINCQRICFYVDTSDNRSPYVLYYTLEPDATLKLQGSIQLSGNILDLTSDEANSTIFVSVDCVREPGSTQTWRSGTSAPQILIESFCANWKQGRLQWEPIENSLVTNVNAQQTLKFPATIDGKRQKEINESLYNLEHLRKRAYADDQ